LPMNRFDPDYHPGRGNCELNCWVRDFDWFCADGKKAVKCHSREERTTMSNYENITNGNERTAVREEIARGKRGNLIGEIVSEGILWTDTKTGKQTLERYETND